MWLLKAQVTLQRLPVQPVWPFLSYEGDSVSDGQHKTMQQLNLGPSAAWAIFHLTYFMSLFVLLCINHDSNLTLYQKSPNVIVLSFPLVMN